MTFVAAFYCFKNVVTANTKLCRSARRPSDAVKCSGSQEVHLMLHALPWEQAVDECDKGDSVLNMFVPEWGGLVEFTALPSDNVEIAQSDHVSPEACSAAHAFTSGQVTVIPTLLESVAFCAWMKSQHYGCKTKNEITNTLAPILTRDSYHSLRTSNFSFKSHTPRGEVSDAAKARKKRSHSFDCS